MLLLVGGDLDLDGEMMICYLRKILTKIDC